jgi:5'-3' exonuclease
MDFNCLIYQCVRAEGMPAYTAEGREAWEAALIEAVKAYTVRVWETAGRPREVFIAVDGVVPMAKIRQQRQRRFKSVWWAAAEREAGVRSGETWDTNAITPGTAFMEALGRGLRGLCAARGWTVSAADEAGEGEQKLMEWVRKRKGGQGPQTANAERIVVYGLDADLIVLSLLSLTREGAGVASWHLLRELAEFEGARAGDGGAFGALDVRELLGLLVPDGLSAAEYLLEYTCAMSFLGNDFLPHSLSVTMREGGHDRMCRTLTELHSEGGRLVDAATGRVRAEGVAAFLGRWAAEEEAGLETTLRGKYRGRGPPPRNDKERAMQPVQDLPITWKEERCLWSRDTGLAADWRAVYRARWLRGAAVERTCAVYFQGLQWILDYYLGKPVSYAWYYPWNVPPLWSELAAAAGAGALPGAPPVTSPVAPQEQLAMVLPMESWGLVREARLRALPSTAPAYWPTEPFGFFSAGKRWMWECEAEIPILCMERLRALLLN